MEGVAVLENLFSLPLYSNKKKPFVSVFYFPYMVIKNSHPGKIFCNKENINNICTHIWKKNPSKITPFTVG